MENKKVVLIAATTIVKIDRADTDDSTEVVDIIHLSTGHQLSVWSGKASYSVFDKAQGRVEVGAELVSVEDDESYSGEAFKVFTFA